MEELELFSLMLMEGGDLKINKTNMPQIHPRIGAIEVDFVLRNPKIWNKYTLCASPSQRFLFSNECSLVYSMENRWQHMAANAAECSRWRRLPLSYQATTLLCSSSSARIAPEAIWLVENP
ncbi:hypothetical protein [Methanogenium cariaci]|jgi:hypothetical protein|uniref:hypothetical protein n=1 Tax=Methanogenium cariaci TaxID=2197 RepID=UPI0012F69275|nr:hypothetical protein [Methanogenium cariaci]